jgi:two-component system sensor kinase FixL
MNEMPVTQGPLRMVSPQLEGLLNAASDGVLILDHRGRIRLMGQAAEHMFGCRESDMLGHQVDQLLPDFFREMDLSAAASDQIKRLERVMPLHGRRVDGTQFAVELAVGRVYGIDPPRFITFIRDISERLRQEAALRHSEAALHTAQRLANIGNYIIHYDASQEDYASLQLRRMFNWYEHGSVSHMLLRMLSVVHPADREQVTHAFSQLASDGRSIDMEYRVQLTGATPRHIHHLAQLQRDDMGRSAQQVGTVHDITERKLADFELRDMQSRIAHFGRISMMGEMATGLAHEVNQPLTAIASYAQACRRMMINDDYEITEVIAALEQIAQQALRAGEVIRRVRSFAKYHEAKLAPTDANRLIEELAQLGQTDAHYHNVRLILEPAPEAPVVHADAVQIQQVLLNLMRNAIDAMQSVPESQREIVLRIRLDKHGDVEFRVADRGTGLPPEISLEDFNAFFTTKATGTGLGLSISQSIIRAHGGRLWCTDNPGGGACFMFSLPSVVTAL